MIVPSPAWVCKGERAQETSSLLCPSAGGPCALLNIVPYEASAIGGTSFSKGSGRPWLSQKGKHAVSFQQCISKRACLMHKASQNFHRGIV